MTDTTTPTNGVEQAAKDPTDFDGTPTLRYKVDGDEYLARAIDEDEGYIHQFADGSGRPFRGILPSDATILATANSDDQVLLVDNE